MKRSFTLLVIWLNLMISADGGKDFHRYKIIPHWEQFSFDFPIQPVIFHIN
jgi:hypothetical protein